MRSRRSTAGGRRALAAATTLLLAGLAACGGGGDTGSGRPAVSPVPEDSSASLDSIEAARPRPGDCHEMTLAQVTATSADNTSTDCLHRPSTITVAVGRLAVKGKEVEPDSRAAQDLMRSTCQPRLARWLGTDLQGLRLSRLTAVWFVPTPEQVEAGATWFRCDVVGFDRGDHLFPLPPPNELQGALRTDKGANRYALCGTDRPGAKKFRRVTCSLKHTWRAVATIDLAGGKAYPGAGTVREDGDAACSDTIRERAGMPLEYDYGWEWPTAQQWRAGQRFGYCWAPV
jgi:hypothetical protein